MRHLAYLNKFYFRYKWRLLLGVAFVLGSNYFGILIPQKIREALNYVQDNLQAFKSASNPAEMNSHLNTALIYFALTVVGFMLLKGLLMYLMRQTIIVTSRLIEYDMRKEIYEHLQTLDHSFYKHHKVGDLMARITEDVSKVRNYLGPGILYAINLVTLFTFTIVAMIRVNPTLAFYSLLPLPLLSISIYYVSKLINQHSTSIQQQMSKLTTISQEVFSGIRVVKSYGKEAQFGQYFNTESEEFRLRSLKLAKVNAYFHPLMILLINISTLLVLIVGGHQVAEDSLTPGNIAEFIIYVNMLTWPVTSIGWIASVVQEAAASQERINELLDTKPILANGSVKATDLKGKIEFRNVCFTYKETGIVALDNVSFVLQAGERLAIIGKTAAGKSTMLELLLRIQDPDSGIILLDDRPLADYDIQTIRHAIGYVPQDVFLFSDTVAHNIQFSPTSKSVKDIPYYAEAAAVHQDIVAMPQGYDTIVGERGVTLSGGQKQRISIARALIKHPEIVVLDDSLSAVDAETEHQIFNHLDTALTKKTVIVVTHRWSTQFVFDKVLILENGKVLGYGNPNEMVMVNDYFNDLVHIAATKENQIIE